jgi:hypothetical protein
MKEQLDPSQFLPLNSIKTYFSSKAKKLRDGKTEIGERFPVTGVEMPREVEERGKKKDRKTAEKKVEDYEEDYEDEEQEDVVDEEEGEDDDEEGLEEKRDEEAKERSSIVSRILAFTDSTPDLLPDDWIAVDLGSTCILDSLFSLIQRLKSCK